MYMNKELKKNYDKLVKYSDLKTGIRFVEKPLKDIKEGEKYATSVLSYEKAKVAFQPGHYELTVDGKSSQIDDVKVAEIIAKINSNVYTICHLHGKLIPDFDYETHTKFRKAFGKTLK